jgi:chromosome partitioning protein
MIADSAFGRPGHARLDDERPVPALLDIRFQQQICREAAVFGQLAANSLSSIENRQIVPIIRRFSLKIDTKVFNWMNASPKPIAPAPRFSDAILDQGNEISTKLDMLRMERFPPNAQKTLRSFSLAEVAGFIDVSPSYLKKLHLQGKGPQPATTATGRRYYTADQIDALRETIDRSPRRRPGEKLQVISVVNFKGGSGKTTTAVHLSQYLSLRGFRVLAIDLDPQASMSALFGIQPELDSNPSFYEALRYDDERRSVTEIIQQTNFPNLNIVPANLELQEYEYDTPIAMQRRDSNAGKLFYTRIGQALAEVDDQYDLVVIDCPPQLGYLTLTALTASSSVLITVHPQMLDIMSMSQFLLMLGGILKSVEGVGVNVSLDWFRYCITRYEPGDVPQQSMVGFMQSMFAEQMLKHQMVKSTAISDAGLTKQSLYEVERAQFTATTYDRARETMDNVNNEIVTLINRVWGRPDE